MGKGPKPRIDSFFCLPKAVTGRSSKRTGKNSKPKKRNFIEIKTFWRASPRGGLGGSDGKGDVGKAGREVLGHGLYWAQKSLGEKTGGADQRGEARNQKCPVNAIKGPKGG